MPVLKGNPHQFVKTSFGTLFTPESGVIEVVERHVPELKKLGFKVQSEESTPPETPTEGEVEKSAVIESTKELSSDTTKRVLSAETGRSKG